MKYVCMALPCRVLRAKAKRALQQRLSTLLPAWRAAYRVFSSLLPVTPAASQEAGEAASCVAGEEGDAGHGRQQ